MPIPSHLLERAYLLINAKQLQNAELVLDAVVRVDPQNVEAWKTYMQIHQTQNDLDWLKERVLKTRELSEADKAELIYYHYCLTQRMDGTKESIFHADAFDLVLQRAKGNNSAAEDKNIRFELVDVFDYPAKIAKKEPLPKPRQRAIYNTIILDIAIGVLKTIARHPGWRKVSAYIQKINTFLKKHQDDVASAFVKTQQASYVKFLKLRHSKMSVGIPLLALFALGIRLFISGYFLGYVFLVMFVIGGGWWLLNSGNHSANISQTRVYLHEDINNLPAVKEVEIDQDQEIDEDDFWKTDE